MLYAPCNIVVHYNNIIPCSAYKLSDQWCNIAVAPSVYIIRSWIYAKSAPLWNRLHEIVNTVKTFPSCFYDFPLYDKGKGIFFFFFFYVLFSSYYYYYGFFFLFSCTHMRVYIFLYFHYTVLWGWPKGNNIKCKRRKTISPPGTCGGPRHWKNKHQKGQ